MKTGSLITRVSSDTDRIWEFLAFGVVEVSLALVSLFGLSAVLISLDLRLGLVMAVPVLQRRNPAKTTGVPNCTRHLAA